VFFPFSLVTFNISFVSNFCQFNYYVSQCVFLDFILPGILYFLDLIDYFLYYVRELFSYYLFKYFLRCFLSLFCFWDPYKVHGGVLNAVQRSLRLSSSSFFFVSILFSVFCLVALISTIRSSRSLICSASHILPLIPSSVLFFCLFVL